jgi:hypothetical protein
VIGGFGTPGDATASPVGSVTSAWKVFDDGAVVEPVVPLPHADVTITVMVPIASRLAGDLIRW